MALWPLADEDQMTENIPQPEHEPIKESRTQTIIQHGKTGYDLVHGFFTNMSVQTSIMIILILGIDLILGWPLNPLVLMAGFFFIGGIAWLLFPHAAWNWRIETELEKHEIRIFQIPVEDSIKTLDDGKAKRHFGDGDHRTVTVVGEHLPLSQAHTISDMDYLADTTTLAKALLTLPAIIKDYAVLKTHRGLEVSQLSTAAIEQTQKVLSPASSDDLKGVTDDLLETATDDPDLRDTTDTDDH